MPVAGGGTAWAIATYVAKFKDHRRGALGGIADYYLPGDTPSNGSANQQCLCFGTGVALEGAVKIDAAEGDTIVDNDGIVAVVQPGELQCRGYLPAVLFGCQPVEPGDELSFVGRRRWVRAGLASRTGSVAWRAAGGSGPGSLHRAWVCAAATATFATLVRALAAD